MKSLMLFTLIFSFAAQAQVKKVIQLSWTDDDGKVIRKPSTDPAMKKIVSSKLFKKTFNSLNKLLQTPEFNQRFPSGRYKSVKLDLQMAFSEAGLNSDSSHVNYWVNVESVDKKSKKEVVEVFPYSSVVHSKDVVLFPDLKFKDALHIRKTTAEMNCELKDEIDRLKIEMDKIKADQIAKSIADANAAVQRDLQKGQQLCIEARRIGGFRFVETVCSKYRITEAQGECMVSRAKAGFLHIESPCGASRL